METKNMSNLNSDGMMRFVRAIIKIKNPITERQGALILDKDLTDDTTGSDILQRTATLGMPANVPNKLKPNPDNILKLRAKPLPKNK